jgi:hypothetical protein
MVRNGENHLHTKMKAKEKWKVSRNPIGVQVGALQK